MYIKFLILNIFLISNIFAGTTIVNYGLFKYQFEQSATKLRLTGNQLSLSIEKKECNKTVIEEFEEEMTQVSTIREHFVTPPKGSVEIKQGSKTFYISAKGNSGRYFLQLPNKIKALKVQDKILCSR
jgi:hypothetical protein